MFFSRQKIGLNFDKYLLHYELSWFSESSSKTAKRYFQTSFFTLLQGLRQWINKNDRLSIILKKQDCFSKLLISSEKLFQSKRQEMIF